MSEFDVNAALRALAGQPPLPTTWEPATVMLDRVAALTSARDILGTEAYLEDLLSAARFILGESEAVTLEVAQSEGVAWLAPEPDVDLMGAKFDHDGFEYTDEDGDRVSIYSRESNPDFVSVYTECADGDTAEVYVPVDALRLFLDSL